MLGRLFQYLFGFLFPLKIRMDMSYLLKILDLTKNFFRHFIFVFWKRFHRYKKILIRPVRMLIGILYTNSLIYNKNMWTLCVHIVVIYKFL